MDSIFHQVHDVGGVVTIEKGNKSMCEEVGKIKFSEQLRFMCVDNFFNLLEVPLRHVFHPIRVIQIPEVENNSKLDLF